MLFKLFTRVKSLETFTQGLVGTVIGKSFENEHIYYSVKFVTADSEEAVVKLKAEDLVNVTLG